MKIVVLAGGTSTEREISIVSGTGICGALRQKGHEAILVDIFCGVENVDWENPFPAEYDVEKAAEYMSSFNPQIKEMECTKRDYYGCLIRIAMQPKKPALTDVMLETLSIIAYKQPVTKAEIEKIRGVKSDHAVNKLVEYNLVKELGRLDAPGRPILFGTTEEFLRTFGVQGLEELPAVDPVKMADFKAEAEEEVQLKLDI